jgi:hypothetical protein
MGIECHHCQDGFGVCIKKVVLMHSEPCVYPFYTHRISECGITVDKGTLSRQKRKDRST